MTRLEAIDALQPKGSKMTERVDLDAVRAQVMTVQTGGNVYVFAEDYAALLAERETLERNLKTALDREAETHRRHHARFAELEAENNKLQYVVQWVARNGGFAQPHKIVAVAKGALVEQEKQDDQ